jgi:hypothetical protein
MFKRQLSVLLIAMLVATMAAPAAAQTALPGTPAGLTVPVSGTAGPAGRVTGTFTVTEFVELNGGLGAAGKLALTTARGDTLVANAVMPVTATTRSATGGGGPTIQQVVCEILDLTLGPLDLNLAGLQVHLDTVHLLITADPTAGLLGQLLAGLLCGTAGSGLAGLLEDLADNLEAVIGILNEILGVLS